MTFVALLSISLLLFSLSIKTTSLSQAQCLSDQRDALIQFKLGFNNKTQLHSWNSSTDCCIWDGIECDNQTGLVIGINLNDMSISGELNPALFNLSSLQYLDLSYNHFYNITLPQTGFERLGNLTDLYLSYSGFAGELNPTLFNLSSLQYLDLSHNNFYNITLPQTGFERLGNLTYLDLSYSGFAGELNPTLFNLSSLQVLDLSSNNFYNITLPQTGFERLSNLTYLDLSYSGFAGELNPTLFNLSSLQVLDLSSNNFYNITLPQTGFERLGNLTYLDLSYSGFAGELNPTLFNLSSLQVLDLSSNNFYNITLPQTGFERLGNLTYLDLSSSGFAGEIPIGISSLKHLISLDLSSYNIYDYLPISPSSANTLYLHDTNLKTLLSNLTKLQVLCLDGVDISLNGSEWGDAVSQVGTTLVYLSMTDCGLRGNLPDEIFCFTNLTHLDLSSNSMLSGKLPELTKQSFLQYMFLIGTNLTGPIPNSFENLQYLLEFGLSDSGFYGEIPPSIANLTRLQFLDFSSNSLTGTIPMSLFSHPSLESLYLNDNQLSGCLPEFSNGSSVLEYIYLDSNNLQGQLPISIFKSPHLAELNLESNNFNGTFNLDIIQHNKNLHILYLSHNNLSIIEGKNHNDSFYASFPQMMNILLASCNLKKFPFFLSFQTKIKYLDLSNNSLAGEIPLSICNVPIQVLVLSYNNLTGTMPPCLLEAAESREVLNLRSNKLSGPLPRNISEGCKFRIINLSGNRINESLPKSLMNCHTLEVMDVGNNQIVDRFPFWFGNLRYLRVLVLGSNKFYGTISNMEAKAKTNNSYFAKLQVLDLSSNRFKGIIPKIVFENMKALVPFEVSSDPPNENWYYYSSIMVTSKGQEMEMHSLNIFCSFDLANNKFWGEIPEEIGQLKSLHVLNLSHNALTGIIPTEFGNLVQLESLDLSSNYLSGHIPQQLGSLTSLASLNLSYNNLVGDIPKAHQFSTFSNASYLGNPGLCGSPLSMQCAATSSNHGFDKGLPSKLSTDIIELSVSIGLGLGVGFAFAIWATISWENGRRWFNFIIDKFYFRHFH